ncbi:MAG TPA: hypothetical protein VFK66_00700, partial [Oryzihumus sp.]|nr:hypothetical protein [Oryzihumus sp.]
ERDVNLTVFPSDHPNADAAMDAARRAAGVEDSRLVRVLDVGVQDEFAWIVEESLPGARSVAALLEQGGLPAEEVRRVTGEAAAGLETGRSRGLHHQRLTPHEVMRASDGTVKVSGLAIAAALDGVDEVDPVEASRADAVALVALAYAGLTSRWPVDTPVEGLERAPRLANGVPAPSEIAAGVPGDLDAICRLTLNEGAGPLDPGDLASQIAPWSREQVNPEAITEQFAKLPARSAPAPSTAAPAAAVAAGRAATAPAQPVPATTQSRVAPPTAPARAGSSSAATIPAVSAAPTAAEAAPATTTTAPKAPKVAKVGSFARAAADRAAHATGMHGADDTETISLPEVFQTAEEPEEPPLPLLHTGSEPPSGNQTRIVVTILVGFLVVVLLLGYCGISSIGSGSSLPLLGSAPRHTSSATTPPATRPSSAPPTSSAPTSSAPIAVVDASGFDPEGDQSEKDSSASRVLDGDPSTVWTSEGYNSPSFGGLKKGVGVILDLGSPKTVHSARLTLGNGPADVTVYAAPSRSLDGVSTIGEVQGASDSATVTAPTDLPPARYVIVWFTLIPQDGGRYRASLADIKLS